MRAPRVDGKPPRAHWSPKLCGCPLLLPPRSGPRGIYGAPAVYAAAHVPPRVHAGSRSDSVCSRTGGEQPRVHEGLLLGLRRPQTPLIPPHPSPRAWETPAPGRRG